MHSTTACKIRYGLVVRIPGSHPGGPGSIPGNGILYLFLSATGEKKEKNYFGSGGIRTHASEETGALNQRLRPLGHATQYFVWTTIPLSSIQYVWQTSAIALLCKPVGHLENFQLVSFLIIKSLIFIWTGPPWWVQCLRPYHLEHTSSRPITEVKQGWVLLVLGWVTAWEYRML